MMAMSSEASAHFSKLKEDITCSICLHELSDPVSTACGHNFCKSCISSYWSTPQPLGHCCPECRTVCPGGKLIPAYRLQQLVSNVQQAVEEEQSKAAPPRAEQLVYLDSNNKMCLDESIVSRCFLDSEISDLPLCLICVIGEKRRGKSSLLNYILRALHCLENQQPISLGDQDEPLKGFEWKSGVDSLTKGIWVWNRPFILESNGDKMAVFVLDTEGSLDIESDMETSLKLSALSMLLSSCLIFNVNANLKKTELDYLEMYLHVSELTAESFCLQYLQHLNILIRDWESSNEFGQKAGKSYIEHEKEKLQNGNKYNRVLQTLGSSSTSSFLLPHPGKPFLRSSQGRLSDMDDDFRSLLTTYISDLMEGIWLHSKTDNKEMKITCGQLGLMLKDFVITLQRENFSFDSPMKIFFTLENYKNMDNINKQFEEFVKNKAPSTFSPLKILRVTPSEMREMVSDEASCLLEKYKKIVQGSNDRKEKLMEEMKNLLNRKEEEFCTKYFKRYKKYIVGVGCAVGGGVLTLAGGIAVPYMAGAVLATELAILAGGTVGGAIGIGVGGGVGGVIGHMQTSEDRGNDDESDESTDNESTDNESTPEDTQQLLANAE